MNEIMTLISTVGFPIASAVGMFYLYIRVDEKKNEQAEEFNRNLQENTAVLSKLVEKIDSLK